MAISYFRWIKTSSPDLSFALKNNKLQCTYAQGNKTVVSRSALWVFRIDGQSYKPASGISSDRTLVKITFKPAGELMMEDPKSHLDFEEEEFEGEAKHPKKIIVKNNEKGARGIGMEVLEILNAHIQSIVEASSSEIKKATG